MLSGLAAFGTIARAAAGRLTDLGRGARQDDAKGLKGQGTVLPQIESEIDAPGTSAADLGSISR